MCYLNGIFISQLSEIDWHELTKFAQGESFDPESSIARKIVSKTNSCFLFPYIQRRVETCQISKMEPFYENSFKNTTLTCIFITYLAVDNVVRSNRPEVLCKTHVFKDFVKFLEKHLCQKTQVFSCELCKIFKNTFFHRTLPSGASELRQSCFYFTYISKVDSFLIFFKEIYFDLLDFGLLIASFLVLRL